MTYDPLYLGVDRNGRGIARNHLVRGADLQGANFATWMSDVAALATYITTGQPPAPTDLRKVDLGGCDLDMAVLTGADLRGATLTGANLSAADLQHVAFADASLARTVLREAHLEGADFDGADLVQADLRSCDLRFTQNLTLDQVLTATIDATTVLPEPITRGLAQYQDLMVRMHAAYATGPGRDPGPVLQRTTDRP